MPYDEIYVQIARLLQLYCNAEANDQTDFVQLFSTALALIIAVNTLVDTTNITSYAPSYLTTSMLRFGSGDRRSCDQKELK
jgi:hypothetical protein